MGLSRDKAGNVVRKMGVLTPRGVDNSLLSYLLHTLVTKSVLSRLHANKRAFRLFFLLSVKPF